MICDLSTVVAMVPSLESGDMLLTAVTTDDQPTRDQPPPATVPAPPTLTVQPVSCISMYIFLNIC